MKSTINFIYFLNNHTGLITILVNCFGERMGNHFFGKLKDETPTSIIKMMCEMTDDNKEKFLKWIDENYPKSK